MSNGMYPKRNLPNEAHTQPPGRVVLSLSPHSFLFSDEHAHRKKALREKNQGKEQREDEEEEANLSIRHLSSQIII